MRNLRKFLALVLATLMLAGSVVVTTGAAKSGADYTDAAHHLAALGILKGDENGNLMLDKSVTRYQAALFFVQAITGSTDTKVWNADKSTIFTDVPEYGTAIDYLAGLKFILGRGNGIYGYNDPITYQDMLVLAVRALGYETADMSYPYGHILAAEKLGLTDNIDSIRYKEPLSRGETAQLVWDMLGTELAVKDPITGEMIYPGKQDNSAYGALLGAGKIQRETYLERAGFADGKLTVTVKAFTEGKKDAADTVTVEYGGAAYTLAAADLGITEKTPKINYLGLPMTLYVNCKADDFFAKYDIDGENDAARIVFTNSDALTSVENLGDAGSIKVIKNDDGTSQILLDGVNVKRYPFSQLRQVRDRLLQLHEGRLDEGCGRRLPCKLRLQHEGRLHRRKLERRGALHRSRDRAKRQNRQNASYLLYALCVRSVFRPHAEVSAHLEGHEFRDHRQLRGGAGRESGRREVELRGDPRRHDHARHLRHRFGLEEERRGGAERHPRG